jgi:2,5-furandicarboxylate decarboxylase 1
MPKDLQSFLADLSRKLPLEMLQTEKNVQPAHEATAVLRKLEMTGQDPVVVFNNVLNLNGEKSPVALAFNFFASRQKIAVALGLEPHQYRMEPALELQTRFANPIDPVVIPVNEAPVKEVVSIGDLVDLGEYPVPVHHALDGGPYILGGVMVTKDPDTGLYNLGMIRMQVKGKNRVSVHAERHHHSGTIVAKYLDAGKPAPFAVVIGHHPGFCLGSLWEGAMGHNEYAIAGGVLQEAVRLTASETWGEDFLVPADADIIMEGVVVPGELEKEGPLGEHTRYYKTVRGGIVTEKFDPAGNILAITRRDKATFLSVFIGHKDHVLAGSLPKEAVIMQNVQRVCPGIKEVHMTPGGQGRYICYLALKQRVGGEARNAILAALSSDWHIKYVVAVDEDVDIYNDSEVWWAIATRTQADRDFFVIPEAMGATLDPTVSLDPLNPLTAKMGIDATKPVGQPFSDVCEVDQTWLMKVNLSDYFERG